MKKSVSRFVSLLILCSFLVALLKINLMKASETIYIRADGSVEGTDKIQREGNVYTFTGNIYDSIVVERDNIVVDGAGYTIQGTGTHESRGIDLSHRSDVTISNMRINYFDDGILLGKSSNKIADNYLTNNSDGICLEGSSKNNIISGNNITNNWCGIRTRGSNNIISANNITNNKNYGIYFDYSSNNSIVGNNITNNGRGGIYFYTCSNNIVSHNNFINNTKHVEDAHSDAPWFIPPSVNIWDDGRKGNYWSDYEERYPNATEIDGSGIWDTPYVIYGNNQDNHPLMNNWVRLTPQSEPNTAPPTQWNKGYTELHGTGNCVIQTNDGGYAIAGVSYGKFLLVKASSTGDVQWRKTYQDGVAYSIVQTSDGGYVLAGNGTLFNLVKTDSAGNMQWTKDYSKLGLPFLAKSLIQTSDGGYALAGWTSEWDWTIKTDSNGNMQWNKTYGTERAQSFVTAIVEADDGGYALTGNDLLIKIDSSGNAQWNRTYEFVSSLVKTKDSGYLLVGSAMVGSAWLVKTDSQGNMQWTNKYGINGTMNYNVFSSAVQTRDGGYVVAGVTYPIYDGLAWIVKTSASGNMEWNAIYEPVKGSNNIANWIIQTDDGGYVFTGSKGVGRGYTEPGDVWLVKIATTIPEPFPTWIVATTAIVLIVVVGAALLVYFRKIKKTTGEEKRTSPERVM